MKKVFWVLTAGALASAAMAAGLGRAENASESRLHSAPAQAGRAG